MLSNFLGVKAVCYEVGPNPTRSGHSASTAFRTGDSEGVLRWGAMQLAQAQRKPNAVLAAVVLQLPNCKFSPFLEIYGLPTYLVTLTLGIQHFILLLLSNTKERYSVFNSSGNG